jgi:hypothetical protein
MNLPDTLELTIQNEIAEQARIKQCSECLIAMHLKAALNIAFDVRGVEVRHYDLWFGHERTNDQAIVFQDDGWNWAAQYRLEDDAKAAADLFDETGKWVPGQVVHLTKITH